MTPHNDECDERIATLEAILQIQNDRIDTLETQLAFVLSKLPPILEAALLPSTPMSRLECQVFYTPDLTANQRKRKTVWSLRLTAYINGVRQKPDINVRLFSGSQFYNQVMVLNRKRPNSMSSVIQHIAEQHRNDTETLLGMLQRDTFGDTSWCGDQFVVVTPEAREGRITGKGLIGVVVGSEFISLTSIKPGNGTKKNSAKWYLDWHRPSKEAE